MYVIGSHRENPSKLLLSHDKLSPIDGICLFVFSLAADREGGREEREGGVHIHVWLPIKIHMEEILPSYRSPVAIISNWCHLFVYVVYSHYLLTEREGEREKDGKGMHARTYVYQLTFSWKNYHSPTIIVSSIDANPLFVQSALIRCV